MGSFLGSIWVKAKHTRNAHGDLSAYSLVFTAIATSCPWPGRGQDVIYLIVIMSKLGYVNVNTFINNWYVVMIRPVQIEGRVGSRVGSWGSIDRFFLTLTLPDPPAGWHTSDPDPDPAGTLRSAGRTRPSDVLFIKGENCLWVIIFII